MSNTTSPTPTAGEGLLALLDSLFPWLNKNLPIKPDKLLGSEDVAHLSLTAEEFAQIPAVAQWCAHKRISFKRAYGVEFWLSKFDLPSIRVHADLRGRIAWRLTKNTAALFQR